MHCRSFVLLQPNMHQSAVYSSAFLSQFIFTVIDTLVSRHCTPGMLNTACSSEQVLSARTSAAPDADFFCCYLTLPKEDPIQGASNMQDYVYLILGEDM